MQFRVKFQYEAASDQFILDTCRYAFSGDFCIDCLMLAVIDMCLVFPDLNPSPAGADLDSCDLYSHHDNLLDLAVCVIQTASGRS